MHIPNFINKSICTVLIVCQIGLLFHNISYAAPAHDAKANPNTVEQGYNFGMQELEKLQNTTKGISLAPNGDLSLGDKRLDSILDEDGKMLNTNRLSPDQKDKDVEKRFYSSGERPSMHDLQGLQRTDLTEKEVDNIGFSAHEGFDEELKNKGDNASYQAQIHAIMNDSYNNADPSFANDPALDAMKEMINDPTNPFTDCEIDKKLIAKSKKVHKEDLKQCVENNYKTCTLTHNPELAILKYSNAKAVYGVCGEHCVTYYIGEFPYDNNEALQPGACESLQLETIFLMKNIESIKKVVIESVSYAGSVLVYIPGASGKDQLLFAYDNAGKAIEGTNEFRCDKDLTGALTAFPVIDITDFIKKNFKDGQELKFVTQFQGAIPYTTVNIEYDPTKVAREDDYAGEAQCLISAQGIYKKELKGSVKCLSDASKTNGKVIISGVQLDPKYLNQSFGLKGSCTLAEVKVDKSNYESMKGSNINLPLCDELEKKGCGYIKSKCVKMGSSENFKNTCLLKELTYDCGYDTEVAVPSDNKEYVCPGAIACMGIDCMNISIDSNEQDFNKALGLLQQSQAAANDMSCRATDKIIDGQQQYDCDIFPGKQRWCNNWNIVGMGNDCCSGAPVSGDWAQTTRQVLHLSKNEFVKVSSMSGDTLGLIGIDSSFIQNEVGGDAILYGTVWDMVKKFTPIGKVEGAIMQPITNALNNILPHAGEIFAGVAYYAQDLVVTYLMKRYVMPALIEGITSALVSAGIAGGAASAGEVIGEGTVGQAIQETAVNTLVELGMESAAANAVVGFVAGALSVIGWVYAAYTIGKMVIGLVTKCDNDEFELQSHIMQKNCDYVGGYCAEKIPLIGCVKHKSAYCCFTSPLSRILNKQIKFGLNHCYRLWPNANPACAFGNPHNPNCSAITLNQLEQVDWTEIDMTEWLELLKASNALSSENITLNKIADNALPVGGRDSEGQKHQ